MTGSTQHRLSFAIAATAFLLVVLVGLGVSHGLFAAADRAVLLAVAAEPGSMSARIAGAFTWLGDARQRLTIAFVAALLLVLAREPRTGGALLLMVASGMLLVGVVKAVVARPRPDLLPHLDIVASASFPSAHAASNMILWLAIALLPRRGAARGWILAGALALAVAIGASRVVLAVHWPSDVIAGWLLGAGWVMLWLPLGVARRR